MLRLTIPGKLSEMLHDRQERPLVEENLAGMSVFRPYVRDYVCSAHM